MSLQGVLSYIVKLDCRFTFLGDVSAKNCGGSVSSLQLYRYYLLSSLGCIQALKIVICVGLSSSDSKTKYEGYTSTYTDQPSVTDILETYSRFMGECFSSNYNISKCTSSCYCVKYLYLVTI